MLSEEEIEKDKRILKNISECVTYSMWSEDTEALRRILKYIDQLESDKQKLIEKLEEDLNDLGEQTKDNYLREKANYTIRYLSEYREILKGEKE